MLVNMNQLLAVAKQESFAIPAFNIGSDYLLKAVLQEAEAANSPVILEIHPDEMNFSGESFCKYVVECAKEAKVPIAVHLDHGGVKEDIVRAIRCGFTSVMIDASHASFEENIKVTKEVVDLCKPLNISVEAELGTIGNNDGSFEGTRKDILYTNPDDVRTFIKETNIDTLAIAIGTAHGLYPPNCQPQLRLDILQAITNVTDTYLVLHGGSNNKDDEIRKAATNGIQKVNISSDYKSAFYSKCRDILTENRYYEPHQIYDECIKEARKVIKHKFELLGSHCQASKY